VYKQKCVCIDFGSVKNIESTLREYLNDVKNKKLFKKLYDEAVLFGETIGMNMNESIEIRRQNTIPSRIREGFVMILSCYRDYYTNEEKFRTNIYFSIIA
ncbi:unnamed protein product, partial [Rotaria sp. Silwood2]